MFKQKHFQFMLEMLRVCYFLNCMGQVVSSFRPSMGRTALAKLQPSCQWSMTVSPGRSETGYGRDICGSSNEIRQIRWTIAGMYKVHQNTQFVADMMLNRQPV